MIKGQLRYYLPGFFFEVCTSSSQTRVPDRHTLYVVTKLLNSSEFVQHENTVRGWLFKFGDEMLAFLYNKTKFNLKTVNFFRLRTNRISQIFFNQSSTISFQINRSMFSFSRIKKTSIIHALCRRLKVLGSTFLFNIILKNFKWIMKMIISFWLLHLPILAQCHRHLDYHFAQSL